MKIVTRPGTIDEAVELSREIPEFEDPYGYDEYRKRLRAEHVILVATIEEVPIGFKVGYDRFQDRKTFYSWMGGVHPSYRKMGVAKMLLQKMEVWCRIKGYQKLQFKTMNKNKSMIHFAIDQGFEVVDFKRGTSLDQSKVYFEKNL